METVLLDFNKRAKEVHDYFIFMESLEKQTTKLAFLDTPGQYQIQSLDPELAKTLKANGFLLLYNLVESTMRNAIEAIFEEFKNKAVSFDQLKPKLKMIVLQNLKNRSPNKIYLTINQISTDIITATFEREELFSGNVDARLIKEIAEKYGFSYKTDFAKTKNGQNILVVKSNRNDLAHGIKSFEEVGQDKTIEELLEIKKEVIEYLRQILENIKTYLDNQEYLDVTTNNP
ncbi:MAE_28990/MAE_18760 family HEPN-like nuclease [Microcoleus sp. bin38.metabat.b11b12b14.051]|uniref:MAE_28990/MAE_18760 family HEPN-like nuclease n=1 Tax=Microcoleus sp. bin38.metabat.b11b12b14.051 TaxID=2742709 RepID=UPI0025FA0F38|nr:MAE_28990/MAE_18760 family HEPN-like nuclease [Microcoleus sp. bin38.metabat.b11b12b14.051]